MDTGRSRAFREALAVLARTTDPAAISRSAKVLERDGKDFRPLLLEAAATGPARVRALAIEALGKHSAPEQEAEVLAVVRQALRDPAAPVRIAALKVLRNLGSDHADLLTGYFPAEALPNVRKLAVRTLERWGEEASAARLARLLREERDADVRQFVISALQNLSGKAMGDDVEAWEKYAQEVEEARQRRRFLEFLESRRDGRSVNEKD